jgi:hypothetical protein
MRLFAKSHIFHAVKREIPLVFNSKLRAFSTVKADRSNPKLMKLVQVLQAELKEEERTFKPDVNAHVRRTNSRRVMKTDGIGVLEDYRISTPG